MSTDMKHPKCKEGIMKLPLALKLLKLGDLEQRKEGQSFVCIKCGNRAHPAE